ncbi:MAG: LON peptidase substrate-binding domain-containing protein [Pseudomonadales bacterium]
MLSLPLFPLHTVLFPGCRIPLQIFEQRYLEMVKSCLKQEQGFVIVLINEGKEVGSVANLFSVGAEAKIVDWHQLDNGLLGITVEGVSRVMIRSARTQSNGLLLGEVERLKETPVFEHKQLDSLLELLTTLRQHPAVQQLGLSVDESELNSLFWCLSGLMPFSDREKQYLLELNEPPMRIGAFNKLLKSLQGVQT